MTSGRVEIITSVQRWRRWTSAEKRELVAASLEPGASVSTVAREAGVHPFIRSLRADHREEYRDPEVRVYQGENADEIGEFRGR
jgi:transposase-like protein